MNKLPTRPICLLAVVAFVLTALSFAQPEKDTDPAPEAKKAARYADALAHRPTPVPDRIILTWKGNPATSQAVTWRTDTSIAQACAEIAVAEGGPAFSGYGKSRGSSAAWRVDAVTTPLKTDLGEAHYHSVNFEDLQPGARYLYRVGDGVNWSEWFQFQTAVTNAEPFSFLYFGDAQNDIKAHWSRVIRQAYRDAPNARFMIHAGDLINRANSDAEWGEWFAAGGWLNGSVPSVPVPGNHEWFDANARPPRKGRDDKDAKPDPNTYRGSISRHWRPQFTLPENGPEGQEELAYWFDYQGVRFVCMNSNEGRYRSHENKESQARWLESVLAGNPNRWTIVTFHHPVFSPAKQRDNPDLRRIWQPLFDKYKVDLVLQGHDHTYARSGLLTVENSGSGGHARPKGGTVYAVSVSGPKMYDLNKQNWMKQSAEGLQLYQVIRVDGDKLRYEARTATGDLHDVFELRKQKDGLNELVEREQLDDEARGWWGRYSRYLIAGFSVLGAAGIFLLLRRRFRRAKETAAINPPAPPAV